MKVTLDIEPSLIGEIEGIAKRRKISLSELTSYLFKKEVSDDIPKVSANTDDEIADWVKKLSFSKNPTPDFDYKAEYHTY